MSSPFLVRSPTRVQGIVSIVYISLIVYISNNNKFSMFKKANNIDQKGIPGATPFCRDPS